MVECSFLACRLATLTFGRCFTPAHEYPWTSGCRCPANGNAQMRPTDARETAPTSGPCNVQLIVARVAVLVCTFSPQANCHLLLVCEISALDPNLVPLLISGLTSKKLEVRAGPTVDSVRTSTDESKLASELTTRRLQLMSVEFCNARVSQPLPLGHCRMSRPTTQFVLLVVHPTMATVISITT